MTYHIPDRGYDLLRTLVPAFVISHMYDEFRTLGSASCDVAHEIRGTFWCGHNFLYLVMSHARHGIPFIMGTGFCIL